MPREPGTTEASVPDGIDAKGVTAWFETHVGGVVPPLRFSLVTGGRSNLTFRVEDAGGALFILRRPPVTHVLPTAHDMAREHRLISAMSSTPVPVPRPLGLCTDDSVTGSPFYVMELVDGHVLRDARDVEASFSFGDRKAIGENVADTLAVLHRVDIDEVGLGDLARRDGYVARQVRRWSEQYRNSALEDPLGATRSSDAVAADDLVAEVGRRLSESIPLQGEAAIVHGDYRLDNVVLDDAGQVCAILDWELCTLGDPLADLGLLLVYWAEAGETDLFLGTSATTAPGFATRHELAEHYAKASGRDVSEVGFFVAFGYWKLACILQGVYARHLAGAGAGDPGGVEELPRQVRRLAEHGAISLGVG